MDKSEENFMTENYLDKLNPTIRNSLNYEQKREISCLLKRLLPQPFHKHTVEVRFNFWFLKHWYMIFLLGANNYRDQKVVTAKQEKTFLSIFMNIFFTFIMVMGILATIFLLLYLTKTLLGIDIFPDKHLLDFI